MSFEVLSALLPFWCFYGIQVCIHFHRRRNVFVINNVKDRNQSSWTGELDVQSLPCHPVVPFEIPKDRIQFNQHYACLEINISIQFSPYWFDMHKSKWAKWPVGKSPGVAVFTIKSTWRSKGHTLQWPQLERMNQQTAALFSKFSLSVGISECKFKSIYCKNRIHFGINGGILETGIRSSYRLETMGSGDWWLAQFKFHPGLTEVPCYATAILEWR